MAFIVRLHIRIDNGATNQIYRFENEKYDIASDEETGKMHRLKLINGVFNTQEITITNGAIVEVGNPVAYVKV